jgi:hypothetical protein
VKEIDMATLNQVSKLVTLILLGIGIVGCDSSTNTRSSGGGASMGEMAAALDAKTAAEKKEQQRLEAERKAEEARQAAAAQPQIEVVTAHSPKKGRSLEGGGYLSVVAGTRFWAEHQIILNHIRHAMELYRADKGDGSYPKTQDEFMREIIEPNLPATRLPELPEGWEYYYDPEEPLTLKMINRGGGTPSAVD